MAEQRERLHFRHGGRRRHKRHCAPMTDPANTRLTERLRLEPIGPENAYDLWQVHNEDDVAAWYDGVKPSIEDIDGQAKVMVTCWRLLGVHKWMAYDRVTGELIGR